MPQYIAAIVRPEEGGLTADLETISVADDKHEALDEVADADGAVIALWDYDGTVPMVRDHARGWAEMVYPSNVYVKSSWGEFLRLDQDYLAEVKESS